MKIDWQQANDEFHALVATAFPLQDFDPICKALEEYQRKHPNDKYTGQVLPNRILALMAVRLMDDYERDAWERD